MTFLRTTDFCHCMDIQILIVVGLALVVLLILVASRTGDRYGKIRPSREVTEAYERFQVNPDLRYFTSGPDDYPNAIMGIDKTWTLDSDLWKVADLDSRRLKALVLNMQSRAMESTARLLGSTIYDNRGKNIGDWYSQPGLTITVKISGPQRVIVHTPPPDT